MKTARVVVVGVLAVALTLMGCAGVQPTSAMLTYETEPEGATLYEGGQAIGVAPVTRTYKTDGVSPTIRTPSVTALWPSGARTSFFTVLNPGADRVATLRRPTEAPGLQADLDNAKPFIAQKLREAQRDRESIRRDMARDSARCREQMARNNRASDDCS